MIGDCEFRAVRLPGDRPVAEVLRGFGDDRGVFCLRGSWAGGGALLGSEPLSVHSGRSDPLAALRRQPGTVRSAPTATDRATGGVDVAAVAGAGPGVGAGVGGGWFGVLGYPTGRRLHGLDAPRQGGDGRAPDPGDPAGSAPETWLAFYDHLLRWDQRAETWWFESLWTPERAAELERRRSELAARVTAPAVRRAYRAGPFTGSDPVRHLQAVERCISHIRAGDIFQVNAALRLDADFEGSALDLFADVSDRLHPAYAAYVDSGATVLAGLSPELFLRRRGRVVTTSPIKGTRPRTGDADEHEAEILRGSTKDAAENVMIVDLMRNDLGRVCRPGSIRVPRLLEIQPHPGVWHLVSTVTGELRDDVGDAELLAATFPPGSVTGAPKTRAMQIIDQHESAPRRAFTGAVGFASPLYGAEWSVTIRSFEIARRAAGEQGSRISLWAGGGITVDSVPIEEWRECLIKARPLLRAAGFGLARPTEPGRSAAAAADTTPPPLGIVAPTDLRTAVDLRTAADCGRVADFRTAADCGRVADFRTAANYPTAAGGLLETVLIRDGHAIGLADHLARLERSGRELYGQAPPSDLAGTIAQNAAGHRRGRLRILALPVDDRLDVRVTVAPLTGPTGVPRLAAITRNGGSWRHKYADRTWLTAAEERVGPDRLPLFVTATGEVLETSRGNIFLVASDQLVTPPATDSILPGVTRRMVLDIAFDLDITVRIEPIPLARLRTGAGLFSTSAISEVTHIEEVDGLALPAAGPLERAVTAAALVYE